MLECDIFHISQCKIYCKNYTSFNKLETLVDNTSCLGDSFLISWFTDPPTLISDESEKKKMQISTYYVVQKCQTRVKFCPPPHKFHLIFSYMYDTCYETLNKHKNTSTKPSEL